MHTYFPLEGKGRRDYQGEVEYFEFGVYPLHKDTLYMSHSTKVVKLPPPPPTKKKKKKKKKNNNNWKITPIIVICFILTSSLNI